MDLARTTDHQPPVDLARTTDHVCREDWSAPPSSAARPEVLPALPGYDHLIEIGRGGVGVVYRARHRWQDRPAAIMMILGGKYHDPTARVRFLVEAEDIGVRLYANRGLLKYPGQQAFKPYFQTGGWAAIRELAPSPRPVR
ncbi:MAG: hypothetical protein JWO38_6628 [Gemmataceae bacterium]|nr:hypothetical protein [Gemmataceae bacterium]